MSNAGCDTTCHAPHRHAGEYGNGPNRRDAGSRICTSVRESSSATVATMLLRCCCAGSGLPCESVNRTTVVSLSGSSILPPCGVSISVRAASNRAESMRGSEPDESLPPERRR